MQAIVVALSLVGQFGNMHVAGTLSSDLGGRGPAVEADGMVFRLTCAKGIDPDYFSNRIAEADGHVVRLGFAPQSIKHIAQTPEKLEIEVEVREPPAALKSDIEPEVNGWIGGTIKNEDGSYFVEAKKLKLKLVFSPTEKVDYKAKATAAVNKKASVAGKMERSREGDIIHVTAVQVTPEKPPRTKKTTKKAKQPGGSE